MNTKMNALPLEQQCGEWRCHPTFSPSTGLLLCATSVHVMKIRPNCVHISEIELTYANSRQLKRDNKKHRNNA